MYIIYKYVRVYTHTYIHIYTCIPNILTAAMESIVDIAVTNKNVMIIFYPNTD